MVGSEYHRPDTHRSSAYLISISLTGALVYFLNRGILVPAFPEFSFFKNYLGDMLALPVYVPLSVYAARKLKLISGSYFPGIWGMLLGAAIFSLVFEMVIPALDETSITDAYDVLAYVSGGLVLYAVDRMVLSGTNLS